MLLVTLTALALAADLPTCDDFADEMTGHVREQLAADQIAVDDPLLDELRGRVLETCTGVKKPKRFLKQEEVRCAVAAADVQAAVACGPAAREALEMYLEHYVMRLEWKQEEAAAEPAAPEAD